MNYPRWEQCGDCLSLLFDHTDAPTDVVTCGRETVPFGEGCHLHRLQHERQLQDRSETRSPV